MEGAENLRKVATDKKSVSNVNIIVKKSNSKLTELQQELQELESQILVSQGHALNSSLAGEILQQRSLVYISLIYCCCCR